MRIVLRPQKGDADRHLLETEPSRPNLYFFKLLIQEWVRKELIALLRVALHSYVETQHSNCRPFGMIREIIVLNTCVDSSKVE